MYMSVLLTCMCITYMPGPHGRYKRVLDPLKLELGIIVSHYKYWDLNLSPLQTPLFLTNDPSLLPLSSFP